MLRVTELIGPQISLWWSSIFGLPICEIFGISSSFNYLYVTGTSQIVQVLIKISESYGGFSEQHQGKFLHNGVSFRWHNHEICKH